MNQKPSFIYGEMLSKTYNGVEGDLLTGGLGKTGIMQAPPIYETWTSEVLRTMAIYNAYRWLLDTSPAGGFGSLYGPDDGQNEESDGKIAGKEYLAYGSDGSGELKVGLMVQIPRSFNPVDPCIVVTASAGSRGIYGSVPLVGEWALKRGFAVAYTDKGAGMGIHDLDQNTVLLIDGILENASTAGKRSSFTAQTKPEFSRQFPHRIAFKHAHSQQNIEKDWGRYVLWAVRFAYYILNLEENYGVRQPNGETAASIVPDNTLVIAAGVSNGGGSVIRAVEQDTQGLIHGIAASEPNITPIATESIIIRHGEQEWRHPNVGKHLLDYTSLLNVFQPAANLVPAVSAAPMNSLDQSLAEGRLKALQHKGLLTGKTKAECAEQAENIIRLSGLTADQQLLRPCHYANLIYHAICVTYLNAYGRFRVEDRLGGYSFAAADPETGKPIPLSQAMAQSAFSIGNGIPPTAGIAIIADNAAQGSVSVQSAVSANDIMDLDLEGALKLRRLLTGIDESGNPLPEHEQIQHQRIAEGISAVKASGKLKGIPTIIVHGRNDAVLAPNHTSRAYTAFNCLQEGSSSNLRYYEVTNAHHLDFLNYFEGFCQRYIPLHWYFLQALDLMYAHLKKNKPLPPSQVVRTTPRGRQDNTSPPINLTNLPEIAENPAESERISLTGGTIEIPV